jgi:hypothetical protein
MGNSWDTIATSTTFFRCTRRVNVNRCFRLAVGWAKNKCTPTGVPHQVGREEERGVHPDPEAELTTGVLPKVRDKTIRLTFLLPRKGCDLNLTL